MHEPPAHHHLTAREIERARNLGERLKPQVFESVLQYGLYAQVRLAGIADEVMTRLDLSSDARSDFVRLLKRMRSFDPERRRQSPLRRWLPTLRRGSRTEDSLLDRYDRLCHRLDRMLPAIEAAGRQIGDTLSMFDLLFDRNQTYLVELDLLAYGARLRLERLTQELEASLGDDEGQTTRDHIQQLERQAERVEQRIVDLEASADTARDTGPTIRRIQDDLRSLLLEAQYTSLNTATRWKHRFADAVTRARQAEAQAAADDPAGDLEELPQPALFATRQESSRERSEGSSCEASEEPAAASVGPFARLRTLRAAARRARNLPEVGLSNLWWG